MIDKQKTDFLRKKINQIKEDASIDPPSKEETNERNSLYYLILFTLRYFAFFGSQYYIIERTDYKPFGLWESFVIYLTLLTFVSILKKTEK